MAAKHILIVFAHPERRSFNGAILDLTVDTLQAQGHDVKVSDLYQMNFNPVISRDDIKGELKSSGPLRWASEMEHAYQEDRLADDIQSEHSKLEAADLVIFQFPYWWMGFPAILKGWFDRVMHSGYIDIPNQVFDQARFKGKKAMLSCTIGGSERQYGDRGIYGDINVNLWPLQNGVLRFVGYDVLAPNVVYGLDSRAQTQATLAAWKTRLTTILDEQPLYFIPNEKFGSNMVLCDSAVAEIKGPCGPTVGQHLGKPLPPQSQVNAPPVIDQLS